MQSYDHWESGEPHINFKSEMTKLEQLVKGSSADTEWVVFAKSIGSILSFLSVDRGLLSPKQCVFFGIPFDLASEVVFKDDWLAVANFSVPSIAFHNLDDPTASHDFTERIITEHNPDYITLITTKGNTHDYLGFSEYEPTIKQLLGH